jgi:hypothetical protein
MKYLEEVSSKMEKEVIAGEGQNHNVKTIQYSFISIFEKQFL